MTGVIECASSDALIPHCFHPNLVDEFIAPLTRALLPTRCIPLRVFCRMRREGGESESVERVECE